MITSVEIENLRGIRTGRLEGLAPLTVLTGPNACGKSTVLDALLIAASPDPADAVGRAVSRHPSVTAGARWLIRASESGEGARIRLGSTALRFRQSQLQVSGSVAAASIQKLAEQGAAAPYFTISGSLSASGSDGTPATTGTPFHTEFGGSNQYLATAPQLRVAQAFALVRLVDPGLGRPREIEETFTEVARSGGREAVYELLTHLIPGFERLEILAFGGNEFGLVVTSNGRSVPLGLSGDGIQAFIQLSLEIAVAPSSMVLVEEPEVYQHPRAIRQSARALLANVRRGVQMVLTTHSLELIDALLAEASDQDLDRMALFNLALEHGELKSGRRAGKDMVFARETLEKDLR